MTTNDNAPRPSQERLRESEAYVRAHPEQTAANALRAELAALRRELEEAKRLLVASRVVNAGCGPAWVEQREDFLARTTLGEETER